MHSQQRCSSFRILARKKTKRTRDVSHTARWSGRELHLYLHHAWDEWPALERKLMKTVTGGRIPPPPPPRLIQHPQLKSILPEGQLGTGTGTAPSPVSRPLRLALCSHNIHGSSITPALFIGRHPSCLKLACIREEIAGW